MHRIGSRYNVVLPCVYDNSLSYGEQLGQLISKINECIDAVNQKVSYFPTNADGTINWGSAGDFAVSNGKDGITWVKITNGSEVKY